MDTAVVVCDDERITTCAQGTLTHIPSVVPVHGRASKVRMSRYLVVVVYNTLLVLYDRYKMELVCEHELPGPCARIGVIDNTIMMLINGTLYLAMLDLIGGNLFFTEHGEQGEYVNISLGDCVVIHSSGEMFIPQSKVSYNQPGTDTLSIQLIGMGTLSNADSLDWVCYTTMNMEDDSIEDACFWNGNLLVVVNVDKMNARTVTFPQQVTCVGGYCPFVLLDDGRVYDVHEDQFSGHKYTNSVPGSAGPYELVELNGDLVVVQGHNVEVNGRLRQEVFL